MVCPSERPMSIEHIPVLGVEVVNAFSFDRPAILVDGTLGLGGHSELLLRAYPQLRVLGVEWDSKALSSAQDRLAIFGDRFEGIEASYADLPDVLQDRSLSGVDGLLLDLGLSSMQLNDASRGFSFLTPGPLDMRMSRQLTRTAWDLLNTLDEGELARILRTYGEEPASRRIASLLIQRLMQGTLPNDAWEIANVIRSSILRRPGGADPATRCFQALRIAVNGELDNIDRILDSLPQILVPGGRAALIAFHSLEDRRVKTAFQQAAKGCVCPPRIPQCVCGKTPWARLVSRKAIQATPEEIQSNPRARSARLRVLERLA
jgi:16S rRNA (cytosine1402-N4)-methyltransferase